MAIRFDDVTVDFGSAVPIKNMSVTLPEEGLCIVTGVSGAGKSTLLKLIAGLVKPTSGNISGTDGLKLSYVFQEDRLLEWNTAKENLMFVRSDEASAEFWLNAMELGDRFDSYPAELSECAGESRLQGRCISAGMCSYSTSLSRDSMGS